MLSDIVLEISLFLKKRHKETCLFIIKKSILILFENKTEPNGKTGPPNTVPKRINCVVYIVKKQSRKTI